MDIKQALPQGYNCQSLKIKTFKWSTNEMDQTLKLSTGCYLQSNKDGCSLTLADDS